MGDSKDVQNVRLVQEPMPYYVPKRIRTRRIIFRKSLKYLFLGILIAFAVMSFIIDPIYIMIDNAKNGVPFYENLLTFSIYGDIISFSRIVNPIYYLGSIINAFFHPYFFPYYSYSSFSSWLETHLTLTSLFFLSIIGGIILITFFHYIFDQLPYKKAIKHILWANDEFNRDEKMFKKIYKTTCKAIWDNGYKFTENEFDAFLEEFRYRPDMEGGYRNPKLVKKYHNEINALLNAMEKEKVLKIAKKDGVVPIPNSTYSAGAIEFDKSIKPNE